MALVEFRSRRRLMPAGASLRNLTMKHLLISASLFLLVWLGGCKGDSPSSEAPPGAPAPPTAPAAPSAPLSACTLLTVEEASAIIGEAVDEPHESGSGGAVSNCNWTAHSASGQGLGLLVRQAYSDHEAARVYTEAIAQSKSLSNVEPQEVVGIGDKAYWAGGNLNQLNVFKGRYWLIIMAMVQEKEPQTVAKQVAEKALERLPK
jgi:hypothetical protein